MSKVEKLAVACKYLEWKNKRTETESNIISMLSYCLAIWGLIYSWRKKVQKAMNQAIRMLLNCNITKSMSKGLKEVEWLNIRLYHFFKMFSDQAYFFAHHVYR